MNYYKMFLDLLDEYTDSYTMNLNNNTKDVLVRQLVDSYKRIVFIETIKTRPISSERINPLSEIYDPIRAAIFHKNYNNLDEAFWNIFLYVLFGKNKETNYNLLKAFYSRNSTSQIWSWENIKLEQSNLREWFNDNYYYLKESGKFGNHRKYSSLRVDARTGNTYETIMSYLDLIGPIHVEYFDKINLSKYDFFKFLYVEFSKIKGFSRLAIFDLLCMIGKVGLLDIEPDNTYLKGATGPIAGTKLLFNNNPNINNKNENEINDILTSVGYEKLGEIPFIMQILEDAICNWQKAPYDYKLFKG